MSIGADRAPASGIELSTCDREPIHVPGSIQPHGVLLELGGLEFEVLRASRNTELLLGRPVDEVLGQPLERLLGDSALVRLRPGLDSPDIERKPILIPRLPLEGGHDVDAVAHRHEGRLILELEPSDPAAEDPFHEVHAPLQSFLSSLEAMNTLVDLARLAAAEVRRITGFDRVLVYRFDEDGHGTVISESRNERLPSVSGQRFPASDIPSQARELYRKNRIRLIVDASYAPVPIEPVSGEPLDLSYSTLRSVSPVHLEYMRNMGTAASMSISVLRDGLLWGLIACHHASPRHVPIAIRLSCDFLARVFSLQLTNKERQAEVEHRLRLERLQIHLVRNLATQSRLGEGLSLLGAELLAFADASGAAILHDGGCTRIGETPGEEQTRRLVDWLAMASVAEVFATDSLAQHLPWAEGFKEVASGLLAISISRLHRDYILWFRPERIRAVAWAGDPRKEMAASGPTDDAPRLHPRRSFEAWREEVRLRSVPWKAAEIDAAASLRGAILGLVLRRAEELAALNDELEASNRELEAFSYSVSHDLRAPFRHIVGFGELLRDSEQDRLTPVGARYLDTMIQSARFAGELVDSLLAFSRTGRVTLTPAEIDMNDLLARVVAEAGQRLGDRVVAWVIGKLPSIHADPLMMRQVLVNLISNALKYSRQRERAVIEVTAEEMETEARFHVRDNGVGFDMRYVDKLFGVFQRLHNMEDYEGTGIGLAHVRRIVSRHGGRVWAWGEPGAGAVFSFALPRTSVSRQGENAQTHSPRRG